MAQQAAREKAEREARGEVAKVIKKKPAFKLPRGPGRPPRPRDDS